MAAKSAMDRAIERIDADIENLQAMKQYLLAGAGDELAREPKAKRGRKPKKPGLPAESEVK